MLRLRSSSIRSVRNWVGSRSKTRLMSTDMDLVSRPEKRLRMTPTMTGESSLPIIPVQSQQSRQPKKHRKRKIPPIEPFSTDDILRREANALLQRHGQNTTLDDEPQEGEFENAPIATATEIELVVSELSSTGKYFISLNAETSIGISFSLGDSLSVLPAPHKPWVIAVPFALPGERITARIYRHGQGLSFGDLVEVKEPNTSLRDMSRVRCKYFGKCAGCQYQVPMEFLPRVDVIANDESFPKR